MAESQQSCHVGVIGLGVMGGHFARNLASHDYRVCGYNRNHEQARELARAHPEAKLTLAESFEELVGKLERPRRLILLVPAGDPVDEVVDALDPLLEDGDVLVDGGNSLYSDTNRRIARSQDRPWSFMGMGISGGAEGALRGPSMMPGGDLQAWESVREMLEAAAAKTDSGPCVTWCGHRSAGHFVKMVHNGIEYAEMQHLAESMLILRRGLGLDAQQVAERMAEWNDGPLGSFLVEISAEIFRTPDPEKPDTPLVDSILDRAGQKGTGRWTAQVALELAVAVPSIQAAVDARVLSSQDELRRKAESLLDGHDRTALEGVTTADVHAALLAGRIVVWSQGFSLLAAASEQYGYETDLAEIARIWKGGCIIRASLLEDARRALATPAPIPLVFDETFRGILREQLPAWRRLMGAAARAGIATPGLSASLGWLETLTTGRGSASLIQAQRDYFGSHRFERVDDPGNFVHHDWGQDS